MTAAADSTVDFGPPDFDDATVPDVEVAGWLTDDSKASWALRKLAAARAELARLTGIHDSEIARIVEWLAGASKRPLADIEFFEAALIDYRRRLETADPTLANTYRLPDGAIARRRNPDRFVVVDEGSVIDWLAALSDADPARSALQTSRRVLVSKLRDHLNAVDGVVFDVDGEVVPGVEYVAGDVTYRVTVEGDR